jgi:hypothetical protein
MKKTLLVLSIIILSGCATAGLNSKIGGGWIANYKESEFATSNFATKKTGTACTQSILGITSGDSSLEAAKKNGNITKISTVDSEYHNILYVYGKHCTIVQGE